MAIVLNGSGSSLTLLLGTIRLEKSRNITSIDAGPIRTAVSNISSRNRPYQLLTRSSVCRLRKFQDVFHPIAANVYSIFKMYSLLELEPETKPTPFPSSDNTELP